MLTNKALRIVLHLVTVILIAAYGSEFLAYLTRKTGQATIKTILKIEIEA